MRLCCNDAGLNPNHDRTENEAVLRELRDIGFELVGVHGVCTADDDAVLRFRDLTERYDIAIAMSPTGFQPAHVDVTKRPEEHDQLRETLRKVRLLGGDLIHITGGSYDGTGWWHHPKNFTDEALDDLIAEMKKIAPYAEEAGVCVCPETTQWCILYSPERMKEFVDRVESDHVQVTFDPVNHMRPERIFHSGDFTRTTIAFLGNRIGQLHVKDVNIASGLILHIDEAPMGTGLFDHEASIEASADLEPWKTFSLEHFNDPAVDKTLQRRRAYEYIQSVATRIDHQWAEPTLTRERWKARRKFL